MVMMVHKSGEFCEQDSRISSIETRLEYKDEKLEALRGDYYQLRKDISALTISVTELTNTLKFREEDGKKLDVAYEKVIGVESRLDTYRWLLPLICAIVSVLVNWIH